MAARHIYSVTAEKRPIDLREDMAALSPPDRALLQAIVMAALRRLPTLDTAISACLDRPLKPGSAKLMAVLRALAAQVLVLEVEPYAAVNLAVEHTRQDTDLRPVNKLVNAVGRRLVKEKDTILQHAPSHDVPVWLAKRWQRAYGPDAFARIAADLRERPPLDISVAPTAPTDLISRLAEHGPVELLPGTIRMANPGAVDALPGYQEGWWWVQDVAASLPARLLLDALGDPRGKQICDACAAPGGKTAQLAAAGAETTALDSSAERMKTLAANMARLNLDVRTEVIDATVYTPPTPFDAVLLDAPCSATGTLRRNPDVGLVRKARDVAAQAAVQRDLLRACATWVKPGGLMVYATCSLEPEEGEQQIAAFLESAPGWAPVVLPAWAQSLNAAQDQAGTQLRTLPGHGPGLKIKGSWTGMDGFFAACLRRTA